jgi:hypothetical protein
MKKYKNILLSGLLFAFAFFTFHDYVLELIDADTQYELCYLKYDKGALDAASTVHANMHAMLDVVVSEPLLATLFISNSEPQFLQKNFSSFTAIVPQRPPLS